MPVIKRKLAEPAPVQQRPSGTVFPSRRLLKYPEAAKYLGKSVWRIRQMVNHGELKRMPGPRPFTIDRVDLDAWIEAQKKKAV